MSIKAITTGVVRFGDAELDCYNLDDGRRVFSQRGIIRGLTSGKTAKSGGAEGSNFSRYIARVPGLSAEFLAVPEIPFVLPSGTVALGRDVDWFVDLCRAYVDGALNGELHPTQRHLAMRANAIVSACGKVGIAALVDEATGYQYVREAGVLADIFKRALRDQPANWERTWQDDVVDALCRTFRIQRTGKEFPAPLMGVVGKLYRVLFGSDIHEELRRRNPSGVERDIHTQWMSDDTLSVLRDHMSVIRAFAIATSSKTQFWENLKLYANNGRGQQWLPNVPVES